MAVVQGSRASARQGDILIVGGGAIGLTLAIDLSRRGHPVTVLETGQAKPKIAYHEANDALTEGRVHRGISNGRMKALGGTTRLWGGQLVPFRPDDFEGGRYDGHRRWPVAYAEILPFVDRAYRFLKLPPAATDFEAIRARYLKSERRLGDQLEIGISVWLPTPDFTQLFAREIKSPSGPQIFTGKAVIHPVLSPDGARIAGVRMREEDGTIVEHAASTVILAAGTFENAALLLRMQRAYPGSAIAANANVGKRFIDHLHGAAGEVVLHRRSRAEQLFDNIFTNGLKYTPKIWPSASLLRELGIVSCAGTINPARDIRTLSRDLLAMMRRIVVNHGDGWSEGVAQAVTLARIMGPLAWRYVTERRAGRLLTGGAMLGIELEQIASSESYIFLERTASIDDARVGVHYGLDGREMEAVAAFCEAVRAAFEATGLGTVNLDPRLVARDPSFLDTIYDASHHAGGTCMAASAADGVVDADLAVFGTAGLYVAGASTFPSGSFANPTLTAIAFALRLADRLHAARTSGT